MKNCPDKVGYFYENNKMNYQVDHFKDWSFFNSAKHCKMVFWASSNLNGKMIVKL